MLLLLLLLLWEDREKFVMGEELERTIMDLRRALPPLLRLLDMPVCTIWCWWVRVGTTLTCYCVLVLQLQCLSAGCYSMLTLWF